jgi:hypothetical protein
MLLSHWAISSPGMPSFASTTTSLRQKQAALQGSLLCCASSRRLALSAPALLHPQHARRIASGVRRAHAHLCCIYRAFAWRSPALSLRPNVSPASNPLT